MLNYYIESFGDRYIVLFKMYPELMILLFILFIAIFILFIKVFKGFTKEQILMLISLMIIPILYITTMYFLEKHRNQNQQNINYSDSYYNPPANYMSASVGAAHTYDEDHQKRRNRQRS